MNVTESAENYLEAILMLSEKKAEIHAADICAQLGFSRPTVSVMLKNLRNQNLVTVDEFNHIHLTKSGAEIAEHIYERHRVLSQLLIFLGVDPKTAYEDACKMEHDISDQSFACIKSYFSQMKKD